LLVVAAHDDARRLRDLERDPGRRLELHRVGEAECELDRVRALRLRAVADADDVELLDETLRHAGHHVGDQRALQTVQRTVAARVVRTRDIQRVAVAFDRDIAHDLVVEFAFRALHAHRRAVDGDFDTVRNRDRLLPNT
jgi:hypothetical protein